MTHPLKESDVDPIQAEPLLDPVNEIDPLDPKIVDLILDERLTRALEGYHRVHGLGRVMEELASWMLAYAINKKMAYKAEAEGWTLIVGPTPDDLPAQED